MDDWRIQIKAHESHFHHLFPYPTGKKRVKSISCLVLPIVNKSQLNITKAI